MVPTTGTSTPEWAGSPGGGSEPQGGPKSHAFQGQCRARQVSAQAWAAPRAPPNPRPRARPRPARAALTLSRSNGCVQQAAPQEASPPKYQRDTRASAVMARTADAQERRQPACSSCCPHPGPGLRPAPIGPRLSPRTPARTAARAEFKAPPATRARRSQCARAALGAGPGQGRGQLDPASSWGLDSALKRPWPSSGAEWAPPSGLHLCPRG